MKYRKLCAVCAKKPVAINYRKGNITYYRTRCDGCIRKKKGVKLPQPKWIQSGYKKKPHCEKCGFVAKYKDQLFVYYIDGNLNNNALTNFKTVCANCQIEVAKEGLGWRQGDLVPDF